MPASYGDLKVGRKDFHLTAALSLVTGSKPKVLPYEI